MSNIHNTIAAEKNGGSQGWLVLAGVMLISGMAGGIYIGTFGVFLPVICNDFGWNRAELSLAFSLSLLAFGLPSAIWGIVINRLGPRFCILVGNLVTVLGIASLFWVQEIWQVYLLYILIGLGGGFGSYLACIALIRDWFYRKPSLPLGIFVAGATVGSLIFAPLASLLISAYSWRNAFLILAGIYMAAWIVAFILVKNRPAKISEETGTIEPPPEKDKPLREGKFKQIFRLPATWIIMIIALSYSFSPGITNTHLVAYLQDIGYSPMIAATTLSLISAAGIPGSIGLGLLALKFNVKYLMISIFGLQIIGYFILLVTQKLGTIYGASVLIGFAAGALSTSLPVFAGTLHKRENYTYVLGIASSFISISLASSAAISGAIHDATGRYTLAFEIAALLGIVGIVSALFARQPRLSGKTSTLPKQTSPS